jgi:hypothetical protein
MLEIVLSNQLYNNIQCKLCGAVNCAILSCYAASSGNFAPTFRDHYSQRNNPVECRSQLLRGRSLKSHIIQGCSYATYFIRVINMVFLTIMEGRMLKFGNRVLRSVFGMAVLRIRIH